MNTKYSLPPASLLLVLTLLLLSLSSCRLSSSHLGFTKVDSTALPDCEALIVDFPIDVKVHVGERTAIVFDPEMPEQGAQQECSSSRSWPLGKVTVKGNCTR